MCHNKEYEKILTWDSGTNLTLVGCKKLSNVGTPFAENKRRQGLSCSYVKYLFFPGTRPESLAETTN